MHPNTGTWLVVHRGRISIPLLGGILVAATAAWVLWVVTQQPPTAASTDLATESALTDVGQNATDATDTGTPSPDKTSTSAAASSSESSSAQTDPAIDELSTEVVSPELTPEAIAADAAGLSVDELAEIGMAAYSDGEFELLQQLVADNPVVMGQLLELYRANTDADRARRLAELLGRFESTEITALGEELVFSGDPVSQQSGLRLLGRQQVRSAEARQVVQQVLAVETNPDTLVAALHAVARTSAVDDNERGQLLDQFTTLTEHHDPAVRRLSFNLIKNWNKRDNLNDVLLRGLSDTDGEVRESATFALLNTPHRTDAVKYALLQRVEDSAEHKRIREGALYALQRFTLTEDEQRRYADARRIVNSLR